MNRSEKPERNSEKEAVFTTIVGGRPPGSGTQVGAIPRGIEVLIKKASVDPEFKRILLEKRAGAASEIDLKLTEAERTMLSSISAEQLEKIINSTKVRPEHRMIFLGKVAVLMLAAATGVAVVATITRPVGVAWAGISPDRVRKMQMEGNIDPSDANDVNEPDRTQPELDEVQLGETE
jgi:hypothetical protein